MYSSKECNSKCNAKVEFNPTGWRQFTKLNRRRGIHFIQAFILKRELVQYLAGHEASGYPLDTDCQEVHYDQGLYLLLRRTQGVWYITEVFVAKEADAFEPVYLWQRVKRGANYILTRILIGWQQLQRKAVARL